VKLEVQSELHSAEIEAQQGRIHSQQGKINCMLPIFWIDLHSAQNAYVRTNPGSGGGKPEAASEYTKSSNSTAAAGSEIRRLYQH